MARLSPPHQVNGLEADVVLLIEVTAGNASPARANLYVAASRARRQLVLFADQEVELPTP